MKTSNQPNEITSIRQAALQFDTFIRDGGIGTSMFFVLVMLIFVNTHSLKFLFGDGFLAWVGAVVGGLGFSFATTAVIRKPVASWMKYLYPVFDVFLVFLGFNLLNEQIPTHAIMTVLISLFTGAILIGLGTINFKEQNEATDLQDLHSEQERLRSAYIERGLAMEALESELESLRAAMDELQGDYYVLEEQRGKFYQANKVAELTVEGFSISNTDLVATCRALESELQATKQQLHQMERPYLLAEKSRILKKNAANRTDDELQILEKVTKL
jgi:hypothetical protein